jgi:hypothetical protein
LGYAAKVGFVLSLTSKRKSDQLSWYTVLWVTLWSTLVGGVLGFVVTLFVNRDHLLWELLIAGVAYLLGATLGNRWAHRKFPRLPAK